jgi:DNA polymerase III subunit gamma/tau
MATMAYEVTATRRRPQSFEQLAGQEFVSSTLRNAVTSGKIAHAYLFSGPRGCGKTSTARILAKALNCEKGPTDKPCGTCPSCVETARGASLDVIEIDGASNTSVENVRQIRDEVLFPPNSSRYKIYIIDEVHMLSNSAFNALLKTIEEPPPYIVFIFATTELHKVPATIKSRCQQFNFRLGTTDDVKKLLADAAKESGIEVDDEALFWIAKESTGSFRDAYTLFDQVASFSGGKITIAKIKEKLGIVGIDELNEFMEACVSGSGGEALESLDALLAKGITVEQLCSDLTEYMRALLLLKQGIGKDSLLGYPAARYSAKVVGGLGPDQAERGLSLCLELHRQARYSVNPRFELELAAAKLASLSGYISPRELRAELESLKAMLASNGGGSAPGGQASAPQGPAPRAGSTTPSGASAHAGSASDGEARTETPQQAEEAAVEAAIPLEAARAGDLGALKQSVIAMLRKTRGMIAASLDKSQPWSLSGDTLTIPFARGWEADIVRQDARLIMEKIKAVSGKEYSLDVRADAIEKPQEAKAVAGAEEDGEEDPVTIAERLFRGQVVGEREIGEST